MLDEHIAACPDCRVEWALIQRTSALFSSAPLVAPPPAFVEQVVTRVQRRTARLVILRGILTLALGLIIVATAAGLPLKAFSALTSAVPINPSVVSACVSLITHLMDIARTLIRAMGLILGAVFGSHYLIILGYLLLTAGLALCWLRVMVWPTRASVAVRSSTRNQKS